MKQALLFAAFAASFSMHALADEHKAHVHGIASLDVAVDGNMLILHLESPLDGVLGFEHAPGNAKEHAAVVEMRKKLADAGKLFAPTTAAQCALASTQVAAPTLEAKVGAGAHGDLDADFAFACARPEDLRGMEVLLFKAFPKMHRIDAQVVSGAGQSAARLNATKRVLSW